MRTTRITQLTLATITIGALLGLSACSDGSAPGSTPPPVVTETATASPTNSGGEPTSPDSPTPTAPESSLAAAQEPLGTTNQEEKLQWAEGSNDLAITDVRMAEHETFTRVVFDINGTGTPGWWAGIVDAPTQQASGLPVDIAGDSFLDVGIEGIAYPGESEVPGLENGSFGGSGIVEDVQLTSIFEARAQFLIGLKGEPRDFSVSLLNDPTRVVVDIVH